MIGIRRDNELSPTDRQQIILPPHTLHSRHTDNPASSPQQFGQLRRTVARMLQRHPLNGIPQRHRCLIGRFLLPAPIKSRPADAGCLTHPFNAQQALRLHHFDLLVDAAPPLSSLFWRRSSILRKAPLKKSISAACRPTSCSSSATRLRNRSLSRSSAVSTAAVARARHRYSHFRGILSSLANLETLSQLSSRSRALARNSGLYFNHHRGTCPPVR